MLLRWVAIRRMTSKNDHRWHWQFIFQLFFLQKFVSTKFWTWVTWRNCKRGPSLLEIFVLGIVSIFHKIYGWDINGNLFKPEIESSSLFTWIETIFYVYLDRIFFRYELEFYLTTCGNVGARRLHLSECIRHNVDELRFCILRIESCIVSCQGAVQLGV